MSEDSLSKYKWTAALISARAFMHQVVFSGLPLMFINKGNVTLAVGDRTGMNIEDKVGEASIFDVHRCNITNARHDF